MESSSSMEKRHNDKPAVFIECEYMAFVVYTGYVGHISVFGSEDLTSHVTWQALRLGVLRTVEPQDAHHHVTYMGIKVKVSNIHIHKCIHSLFNLGKTTLAVNRQTFSRDLVT